jgi:membrane protein
LQLEATEIANRPHRRREVKEGAVQQTIRDATTPNPQVLDTGAEPHAAQRTGIVGRVSMAASRALDFGRRVWAEIWIDELPDRAAALSYYLLFALFPALLFLTALLGFLPWPVMDKFMGWLDDAMPSDMVHQTFLEITGTAKRGVLSIGIVVAFWATSSGVAAIMSALNAVHDTADPRPWWQQRLVALALTCGMAVLAPGALIVLLFGEQIGNAVAAWLGLGPLFDLAWRLLRYPVALLLASMGVALLYYFAPSGQTKWRWLTPGALFAVGSWMITSLGLRLYVSRVGNYSVTYGSIAGVILTLLWLYFIGLALLIGAEIDALRTGAGGQRRAAGTSASPGL